MRITPSSPWQVDSLLACYHICNLARRSEWDKTYPGRKIGPTHTVKDV